MLLSTRSDARIRTEEASASLVWRLRARVRPTMVVLGLFAVSLPGALADAAVGADSEQAGERFWRRVADREPPETTSAREIFVHIRRLCDARRHAERLERLLDLAAQVQDRDPKSTGYGNFKWLWRDAGVTDPNAVEFVMQEAAATWLKHRDWMPQPARARFRELLQFAVEACLRHRVAVTYTNIAILNAGNVAVLGEILHRPEVADEGYRRLEAVCLWTWAFGVSEYCSPTYYGVDLEGLEFLLCFARREDGREQATALRELLWTDMAMNWFPAAGRLAGSHSRTYDFLAGIGARDSDLKIARWLTEPSRSSGETSAAGVRLREAVRSCMPRVVRERWGIRLNQSRTHAIFPDVTLSCSASAYSGQDVPLTVDLPGDRNLPRCYFIADGREDPYGKTRVEAGPSRHLKAMHLVPFWTAAQRNRDAVALVIYRRDDLPIEPPRAPFQDSPRPIAGESQGVRAADPVAACKNLQSHFVLRRPSDGLWLAGRAIEVPRGTTETPRRVPVDANIPVVFRYGTAAIGIRVLWARAQDGTPAAAALVDDGNPYDVIRLTVEHRRDVTSAEAGATLWIRVGSGLTDLNAFEAWRKRFEASAPSVVEVAERLVRLGVPGEEGDVSIVARAPFGQGGGIEYRPEPTRSVLEVNGREIGRPILEDVEPIRSHARARHPLERIEVPVQGSLSWEAEAGFVLHGMTMAQDSGASGGRYVAQAADLRVPRMPGSVIWQLHVAHPGRYYLWARVSAPDTRANSFFVQLMSETDELIPQDAWHLGVGNQWNWQRLRLGKAQTPRPVDLPAGTVWLQLGTREPSTKIDRLFLTPDADARPE